MKTQLLTLLISIFSCSSSPLQQLNLDDLHTNKVGFQGIKTPNKIRAFVVISDLKEFNYGNPFAPAQIIKSPKDVSISTIKLYVVNRQIDQRGKKQIINVRYDVFQSISIKDIDLLVNATVELIEEKKPSFNGDLFVKFYYSSEGDDWLQIPLPPE